MLSAALLLVILLVVGAAYAMNAWNRAIFDALQTRDAPAVAQLSLLYFVILAFSVLLGITQGTSAWQSSAGGAPGSTINWSIAGSTTVDIINSTW
jgi:ABC-type uncharacterized transport system fused permease/ATPase subunit